MEREMLPMSSYEAPEEPHVEILDNGLAGRIRHTGFSIGSLDKSMKVAPWKLSRLLYLNSGQIDAHPDYMKGSLYIYNNIANYRILSFLAQSEIKVDKRFYDVANFVECKWKIPVWAYTTFLGARKSSFQRELSLRDDDNQTFLSMKETVVYVDIKTHRPAPLMPSIIPEQYRHLKIPDKSNEKLTPPSSGIFSLQISVNFSDLDGNRHTNMAVYMRFCNDCASLACMQGKLKHFSGDLSQYKIRSINIRYKGESKVNDKLLITGWEDPELSDQLCFIVYCNDKAITECTMRYYMDLDSKL